MTTSGPKADLHQYLRTAREAMRWKLEGLSEYDVRRPMTPTGTNLLGLVKHLAGVEIGYFGECFGRPFGEALPWQDRSDDPNADLWATAQESRQDVVGRYERAAAHADATIDQLALDAVGRVPWWPAERSTVTLYRVLVHVVAETNRHAGHADVVRELLDGSAGLRRDNDNLPSADPGWWAAYRERLERVARQAGDPSP